MHTRKKILRGVAAVTTATFLTLALGLPAQATTDVMTAEDLVNTAVATVGETTALAFDPDVTYSSTTGVTAAGVNVDPVIDTPTTTVGQPTTDGARVAEVLSTSTAPKSYKYHVKGPAGSHLRLAEDGTVGVVTETSELVDGEQGTALNVHGTFKSPWAVDKRGVRLPATYSVVGDDLVMNVNTAGATFPVVADPSYVKGNYRVSWSWWHPFIVKLQANKTGSYWLAKGQSGACVALVFVPAIGAALAATCAISSIVDDITARYNYCIQFWFYYPGMVTKGYYQGGFCT